VSSEPDIESIRQSRVSILAEVGERERGRAELEKLVDVVNVADMTQDAHIERELLLLKVRVAPDNEKTFVELVQSAEARVLDDSPETYTVEITGANERMDEFISRIASVAEILAVVRSGAMAVARGAGVLRTG